MDSNKNVKLGVGDLTGIYLELDTGYREDTFKLFKEDREEGVLLYLEDETFISDKVVLNPELAKKIYDEVARIGRDNLDDNYKRMGIINSLSYDYKQDIPEEIEELIWDGEYDDYKVEDISKHIDMYYEVNGY